MIIRAGNLQFCSLGNIEEDVNVAAQTCISRPVLKYVVLHWVRRAEILLYLGKLLLWDPASAHHMTGVGIYYIRHVQSLVRGPIAASLVI